MKLYISHRNQTHFDRVNNLQKLKSSQFSKRNSSKEVTQETLNELSKMKRKYIETLN